MGISGRKRVKKLLMKQFTGILNGGPGRLSSQLKPWSKRKENKKWDPAQAWSEEKKRKIIKKKKKKKKAQVDVWSLLRNKIL